MTPDPSPSPHMKPGKEGARKDYSAHNCLSLVRSSGGAADHHGCPYKRMDEPGLRRALARAG